MIKRKNENVKKLERSLLLKQIIICVLFFCCSILIILAVDLKIELDKYKDPENVPYCKTTMQPCPVLVELNGSVDILSISKELFKHRNIRHFCTNKDEDLKYGWFYDPITHDYEEGYYEVMCSNGDIRNSGFPSYPIEEYIKFVNDDIRYVAGDYNE